MVKAIGFYLGLVFLGFCFSYEASAQVAPTNSATISGSVNDISGKPVGAAKVSLEGPRSVSTETDSNGLFVFVGMPLGTYRISAAAPGLGTAMRVVVVQGDTDVAIQYEPPSQNGFKVIANVASTANAHFNITPASVTEVNPLQNAFEGKTSWRTILEQIPGIAQAGLGNGSLDNSTLPDGPLMPVQISINGALPYETATLLDNMPLIGAGPCTRAGAGTDLSAYPLNGFTSADVVRGPGANAPSIVDSIGGSFMLHSPGAVTSNHSTLSVSTDPYGGIVTNAATAMRWGKLSSTITYGVNYSPGPLSNAGVTSTTAFTPSTVNGLAFSCTGSCASQQLNNANFSSNVNTFFGFQTGLLVGGVNMTSAWSQHSGSMALNYALSPAVNVEISYAGQATNAEFVFPVNTVIFTPPAGYTGAVPAGTQLLTRAGEFLGNANNWTNTSSLLEEKVTAQLGAGILQLSALQNRTFSPLAVSMVNGSQNVQLFGGGCIASAPGGTGGCAPGFAPTVFNGGVYTVTFPFGKIDRVIAEDSNNRDLLLSYTTPLGQRFHAGGSLVRSYYDEFGQLDESLGTIHFGSIFEPFASEKTDEGRIFIGGELANKTSLDLSMYFVRVNYNVPDPNNFSAYTNANYSYSAPRLGFVWRPTPAVAVRAAAGGGFAAAPVNYIVGQDLAPCINDPTSPQSYTQSIENLNLRPETSFGFDIGTDIRVRRDTVFSLDLYRTNLYGQFYSNTMAAGTFTGAFGTLPLFVTQFGNLGVSRYEGILVDLRHDVPHGTYWSLSGGLTRGYLVSIPTAGFYNGITFLPPFFFPSFCTNCANLNVVPGPNFNGSYTGGASIPYAQGLGTLGYRWSPEKYIDVVGTYYGNNNTYFRPAFVEWDAHIGYPLSKRVTALVTFRNITGIYDRPMQVISPADMTGAPTVLGPPYPLYGEMYGPRTVLLTTNVRL